MPAGGLVFGREQQIGALASLISAADQTKIVSAPGVQSTIRPSASTVKIERSLIVRRSGDCAPQSFASAR